MFSWYQVKPAFYCALPIIIFGRVLLKQAQANLPFSLCLDTRKFHGLSHNPNTQTLDLFYIFRFSAKWHEIKDSID